MNYYQFHIGDYRRDTAHLTLLEHGVYRQLLDMYYLSETEIPEETEVVYRRLCARTDEEKRAVDSVLSEFFTRQNGWIHTRCKSEIDDYNSKAERARINGKLGGRPAKTNVVNSGFQEETETKANHKPLTINHKPLTNSIKPSAKATKNKSRIDENLALPDDWKNSALEYWRKAGRYDLSAENQFDQFKDHHTANASKMADWKAAWRTWCRNAVQFSRPNGYQSKPITADQTPYVPNIFDPEAALRG